MKLFFSFLLIIFLAFSGYHLTFRGFKLPLFARKFYLTGTEFLFLGLLLGPEFTNVIDMETQVRLEPLTTFLLGWTGLLFGFQFEIKKIRRFPSELLFSTLLHGALTAAIVFLGVGILCFAGFGFTRIQTLITALVLCSAAVPTSQTGLALIVPKSAAYRKNMIEHLRFISGMDGVIALLVLGILFIFRPMFTVENLQWFNQGLNILMILCLYGGLFVLFGLFLIGRLAENEMVLVVIAMTLITGGSAAILNFSPLLMNFFIGLILANMVRNKDRIFNMLAGVEKPVYLLMLLFLGVNWHIGSGWFLLIAAGYSLIVTAGKIVGGYAFRSIIDPDTLPPLFGLGLLAPGGLTLAILLDIRKGFPQEVTTGIIGLILIAVIYNDLASPHILGWLAKNKPGKDPEKKQLHSS
jgi:hypothetical protein